MARKSVHGTTVQTYDAGTRLYSLMSDGVILRQLRIDGRLEGATIATRRFKGNTAEAARRLVLDSRGVLILRREVAEPQYEKPIGPCPCGDTLATLADGIRRCEPDDYEATNEQPV